MSKELKWLIVCGALALGEALAFSLARFGACAPLAAFITILVALYGYSVLKKSWLYISFFFLGLTLGLNVMHERQLVFNDAVSRSEPYIAEVVVSKIPQSYKSSKGENLQRVMVPAMLGSIKVRIVYHISIDEVLPRIGERLRVKGWLSRAPLPNRDIHMFWIPEKGGEVTKLPMTFWGYLVEKVNLLREDLSWRAGLGLEHDPQAAALNRAILLGERAALDPEVKSDFVAAGTIHLFAISGLHVMFIAFFLRTILIIIGVPLRIVGVVLIPILWVYAWITGFPPSAVRATLMASFYFSAPFFWRCPNGIVSWALTFLLVHILSPMHLNDVGCRLSFTVMLAILTWARWGAKMKKAWQENFMITTVAWMAGVPITARVFERFTFGGLIANPILVVVASLSVTLGVIGCFTSYISVFLAIHFNNAAALCAHFMAGVSSFVAKIPGASCQIAPWSQVMCAAWYIACFLILWLIQYHSKVSRRI